MRDIVGEVLPEEHEPKETLRRQQLLRLAMNSGWPEIPRSGLLFRRSSIVEDTHDGRLYARMSGDVQGVNGTPAIAFYVAEDGGPVFLERAPGPQSVAEMDEYRARREQRRAARMAPRKRP